MPAGQRPLRVVLAPYGTWGDVAPLLALAGELRRRGHDTLFCAPPDARKGIEARRFAYTPCGEPFASLLDGTQNEIAVLKAVFGGVGRQFAELGEAARGADAIVGSMLQLVAPSVAPLVGARYFYAMFSPAYFPTSEIPVPVPLGRRKVVVRSPRLLRLLYWLRDAMTPIAGRALQKERARLGLPPVRSIYRYLAESGDLFLAFDPELTPVPGDVGEPGAPTGAWTLDDPTPLDAELGRFLDAGPAPVYVGFGSMRHAPGDPLWSAWAKVLEAFELRAVVLSGAESPPLEPSARLFAIRSAPHQQLFPRVCLVAHHGGAGTVATAARAGVPQLVVPHLGDQLYHGSRVAALGLGPPPLPADRLREDDLRRRLEVALSPEIADAAERMAATLAGRSGAESAAELVVERCR